jgi:hypothetical protein
MFGIFRNILNPPKASWESQRESFMSLVDRCKKADKLEQAMMGDAINMAHTAFLNRFGSATNFRKQPEKIRLEFLGSLSKLTKDQNSSPEFHLGFILFLAWAGAVGEGEEEIAHELFKELVGFSKLGEVLNNSTSQSVTSQQLLKTPKETTPESKTSKNLQIDANKTPNADQQEPKGKDPVSTKAEELFKLGQQQEFGNDVEINHNLAMYFYCCAALKGSDKAYGRLGLSAKSEGINHSLEMLADNWLNKVDVKDRPKQ